MIVPGQPKNHEIEPQSNTWSYYRVIKAEIDNNNYHPSMPSESFVEHLEWDNPEGCNLEPKEFELNGEKVYLMHSPSFDYDSETVTEIIDLVVISTSAKFCKGIYAETVQKALKLKTELQEKVDSRVIDGLKSIPLVMGLVGRGTIFDPDRLPTPPVDIDLTVFVEDYDYFPNKDSLKEEIIKVIDAASPNSGIEICMLNLNTTSAQGLVTGNTEVIKGGNVMLSIDVIPFPNFPNMAKSFNPKNVRK